MKNRIIFLLIAICTTFSLNVLAQDDDEATGYIGFRFQPTVTDVRVNDASGAEVNTSATIGYGFGGVLGFNFNEHVGIQAEVLYSSLAQKYKTQSRENTLKLSYINIPLLLRLNTKYSAPVNFNIVAGPQLGLNVGSSISADANGSGTDTLSGRVAVKKSDVGLAYGAGLDFGFGDSGSLRFNIGYRGVIGLVDINDKSATVATNEYLVLDRSKVKTNAIYLGLTFAF